MRGVCLALVLLGWLLARPVTTVAQIRDPHLRWRTLHADHFDVHYTEPLGPLAQRVLVVLDRAARRLRESLGYTSSERVHVVLTDNTDSANGSASVLPRNVIRLFAQSPEDLSALSDYDDWMSVLITHELTHIVHLDQISGAPALLNAIFGKIVAPNATLPSWFVEGLATHYESGLTSGGRQRSTVFDMFLRMDVLEDRLLRLDEMTTEADRWPHGNISRLYGSRFCDFIHRHYGERALTEFGQHYGRQLIPYALNRMAIRATGKPFRELYAEFLAENVDHYRGRARMVEAAGRLEGTRLTFHGEHARAPRFLRDGTVLYFASDGHVHSHLRTVGGAEWIRANGNVTFSPHPDGAGLIYAQSAPHRDIYGFHDLFLHDLERSESTRLTHGLRAREPDVSPDGTRVAFVVQGAGTSHLEVAQLANVERTRRRLITSRPYDQVYTPRWSPDGRTLAVSVWQAGGLRDVLLVDSQTGEQTRLMRDRALDTGPVWSPDGHSLYFSSDRTGIANLYVYDMRSGTTRQITNVMGGAFQPDVSADGRRIVYVGYTSRGFDIFEITLDPGTYRDDPGYHDTRPAPSVPRVEAPLSSSDYNPIPTLFPRAYQIEAIPDAFGTQVLLRTQGDDVAGFHAYEATLGLSLSTHEPVADIGYSYARWPLQPSLRMFRRLGQRSDLVVGGERKPWTESLVGATLAATYTFPGLFSSETVSLNYTLAHSSYADRPNIRLDPNDGGLELPEQGFSPSVGVAWGYSNIERNTYNVSASRGHAVQLSLGLTDRWLGARYRNMVARWSVRKFVPAPWFREHIFAFRYAGGQSAGDAGRRSAFSVGGFPTPPPLDSVIEIISTSTLPHLGGDALRGYLTADRVGRQFHLLQVEYRFPIWWVQQGVDTLPVFVRRLYAGVFADYGDAFSEPLDLSTFRVGVGGELFLDATLAYALPMTIRLGVARGVSTGGLTQTYLHLGVPF